ncbi:MAG: hypothetical protein JWM11_6431 [Planctomycetaceae bacterium]|nr:hypothetical protein [Planctomycetaceae bacterium]
MALPGRFAKPCGQLVVRVRIPCLPLDDKSHTAASVVKWKSSRDSNGMFRVQVLVEALMKQRKGHPIGAGLRLEAGWGRKPLVGSTPTPSALGW